MERGRFVPDDTSSVSQREADWRELVGLMKKAADRRERGLTPSYETYSRALALRRELGLEGA